MSSGLKIDMECGGLDTAFAQRGSTRWLVARGSVPSSRHLKKRRQAARTPYRSVTVGASLADACERGATFARSGIGIGRPQGTPLHAERAQARWPTTILLFRMEGRPPCRPV